MSHHPADSYQQMDVAAMSPAQRVVALSTRLIVMLRQARAAIESGDVSVREARLNAANDILHELTAALDHERGGEIAARLAALYAWLIGECLAVHLHPSVERIDPMLQVVTELHGAWTAAARHSAPQPASALP